MIPGSPIVFTAPFGLGDRVHIGEDDSVIAQVTAFTWREESPQVEVSWMNQGQLNTAWVAPALLRAAAPRPAKPAAIQPSNSGPTASCTLRAEGKAYPRTCAVCGLGPCRNQARAA